MAKRKCLPVEDHVTYVIEIDDWDWNYHFGIEQSRHFPGPYADFRHLDILGKLVSPRNAKFARAQLTFIPSIDLREANKSDHIPKAVGSLNLNGTLLQGILSLAQDAISPVLPMLAADRIRFVVLQSHPLRYRKAPVSSYHLAKIIDPDDFPIEES